MSVIYMKHARHGCKVAVSEEEAKYDEKSGWIRYSLTTPVVPVVAAQISEVIKPPEKPAKRPYHRKVSGRGATK